MSRKLPKIGDHGTHGIHGRVLAVLLCGAVCAPVFGNGTNDFTLTVEQGARGNIMCELRNTSTNTIVYSDYSMAFFAMLSVEYFNSESNAWLNMERPSNSPHFHDAYLSTMPWRENVKRVEPGQVVEPRMRDYYVLETSQGQRAWAFCPVDEQGPWMLHGWFA